jgi:hypothetical protein
MKKILFLFAALFSLSSLASHQQAIQVYYDHIPGTHKYLFYAQMHFEFDVRWTSSYLYSNSTVDTIELVQYDSLPALVGNCVMPGEIKFYRSDTIDLGPIPATGYTFGFTTCCRVPYTSSINFSTASRHYTETTMFPAPGQNYANSSPRFINPVIRQSISLNSTSIQLPAIDPDGDSLFYELVDLMGFAGSPFVHTYITGYSAQQPFGASVVSGINQKTGEILINPTQPDVSFINLQVSAYANGTLMSKTQQDVLVYLSGKAVHRPNISVTNDYSTGGQLVSFNGARYIDLNIGDSVYFDVVSNSATSDSIYLIGASTIFSNTNGTMGICQSACADFNAPSGFVGVNSVQGGFSYVADAGHLQGLSSKTFPVVFNSNTLDSCSFSQQANEVVYLTIHQNYVSTSEFVKNSNYELFPNPASEFISIHRSVEKVEQLKVFEVSGKIVLEKSLVMQKELVQLGALPTGIYFVQVGKSPPKKLVIQ